MPPNPYTNPSGAVPEKISLDEGPITFLENVSQTEIIA